MSGATGRASVTSVTVMPGEYTLSESGPSGYDASAWSCTDGTTRLEVARGRVAVTAGLAVTCTVTNVDRASPTATPAPSTTPTSRPEPSSPTTGALPDTGGHHVLAGCALLALGTLVFVAAPRRGPRH